uniref:Uncharacterized protein n=1 Tax=Anguilla anguilla TaxID=7936 RepID=A0A0E9QRS0_ANGAN
MKTGMVSMTMKTLKWMLRKGSIETKAG